MICRYGGEPVGSFIQAKHRPLVPAMAHAIFFDQTHDNMSPVNTRSAYDLLPSSALVNMSCCASGSNRGYDELVPHHIHVVKEERLYASRTEATEGMIRAKKALNDLHYYLGSNGFTEVYVDQMDFDVVAVTRHCPTSHDSVVAVCHTMFSKKTDPKKLKYINPVRVEGVVSEVILEAR